MSTLKPSKHDGETAADLLPEPPLESDLDYAFRLQLLEAMEASLSFQPSSSSSPPLQLNADVSTSSHTQTLALEQEILDLNFVNQEAIKSHDDLLRWIHDRKVAGEIENIPEDEWEVYGENYERPYSGVSSESIEFDIFRVYFKGLLDFEKNCDVKPKLVGIGVAICDESDELLFQMSKPMRVIDGEWMNNRVVAAKALIEALNAALGLGLKNVVFCCDYYPLYQMVTRRWSPKQDKFAVLLNKVEILQKKFTYCKPSFVARNEFKFAIKLAREAIVSQTNNHAESSGTKIESCVICLEDVDVGQIFSVDDCMHRYCFSCMKQHVEVKLLNAIVPKCPHECCTCVLKLDSCQKFLSPKLFEIMSERLAEAAIPVLEKIYCPYPRCSALMSRSDILENSKTILPDGYKCGARQCIKCLGLFCVNCKVPWHNNMTCYAYKKNNFNLQAEDIKLKTLAAKNLWRQCVKCNHMIELAKGCYHMTCRCGYEFCYTCGAEWKDKKATCTCPLWDDENIMDDDYDDDDDGEFVEDDGYYDSDSDDYY